jgi:predicted nucleic acid-binding protein
MLNGQKKQFLVDTNVIVYLHDCREIEKQQKAFTIIKILRKFQNGNLSSQVLSEFSNVALKKLKPTLSSHEIIKQIEILTNKLTVLPLTKEIVLEALRGVGEYQLSYYDAQIWAVAKVHQIPFILSEDFNSNSVIDRVTFLNPFAENFNLDILFV